MINNLVLAGRLAKDPETRETQSGVKYANLTIAVERSYAAEGRERETDFIDCRAWRGTAEFIGRWFHKGDWIGVEGELQTSTYEAQDGTKRKAVYCQIRQASFLGASQRNGTGQAAQQKPAQDSPVPGFSKLNDDDIPF